MTRRAANYGCESTCSLQKSETLAYPRFGSLELLDSGSHNMTICEELESCFFANFANHSSITSSVFLCPFLRPVFTLPCLIYS